METEEIRQLNTLPGLSEVASAEELLRVKEQQVLTATTSLHYQQNCTSWDSVVPTHEMICELESQGVVSKPHSPFNSPIWPVCKSNGEWKLTVDCHGLNEAMPPLSTAMLNGLELQYGLESKAAKWCHH
ncbi:hypothetical protein DUI87_03689 [Hirundo rustica rustica]|uniref:Uncharacterized protein n=1 Tax=Hirundo rustica rustica TaxID=333673 RepID=A0A3M0L109_HIRRU|nr:hypothetical protein DUI87_03689 [Hirundo rustica rustica]